MHIINTCTRAHMKEITEYIITFLLYGNQEAAKQVGYTADEKEWQNYRVVVVPNGHLGKDIILPDMEQPIVEQGTWSLDNQKTWIIRTDLIYNTFFFISRAEELINLQRDEHGRFAAKYSILGKNNRLMIPSVDEYARMLMKLLDLPLPTPSFSHIYLTHDVDSIDQYRHLRGILGGLVRGKWKETLASIQDIHNDPAFTFSWLISQDRQVADAQAIYFIKDTHGKGYDYPQYKLDGEDFEIVKQTIENSGALIGLHSSYYGIVPNSTSKNQNPTFHIQHSLHRSHYLRCSIDNMQQLADMGVTDDFTMMFPDYVGFRLQTTRAVRWINPKTWQLTNLTLHPMTVMDCTLSNTNYMNLTEDEAYFECQRLFEKVHQNAGEIVLLWHNTNPSANPWHQTLYEQIINFLK